MEPSTALAVVLVDELARLGVREVVLSPGSRSAPLAYALHAADAAGLLRLHVRVDERSAAFLALGLAKASGVPAPVVTTSGTAVANLTPAVLEAHESGVPMLLLTADRPPELRGTRANQTTDQLAFFGRTVRWFHDLGVPETTSSGAAWRTALDRAVAAATGVSGGEPGPVHLNLPLRDPLAPAGGPLTHLPPELAGRPDGAPWTRVATTHVTVDAESLPPLARTLVVLADSPADLARAATTWAQVQGHPVVGEPFGRIDAGSAPRLPHGARIAALVPDRPELRPERVVVVGRLTLTRTLAALTRLPDVRVDLVTADHRWPDPGHVAAGCHPPSVLQQSASGDGRAPTSDDADAHAFRAAWEAAAQEVGRQIHADLTWPDGPAVASTLLTALPDDAVLFLGSSAGVRHVDLVRGLDGADTANLVASRGLAGIDGCVSTATGIALASTAPTYAFLGDLTFCHDANGLLIGPDEPVPDLTIVVANDDGGAIFASLEYGQADRRERHPGVLERVFRTPTGTRLDALCDAHGVRHTLASTAEELEAAVTPRPSGLHVVEVPLRVP
ncbi:MAG: 2-succinyl-5-enolpyruvyl-6-hydroxy-3-cyclohexene-1-carboxylic-acid synthase [Mobilicoccus sp.]|nr:2-succinyl-5-enolpyruvyl-6-hydroxy-3-cyclohexene-1-carboxylic-acid synthase [Mobilicoccus sp.]